MFGFNDYQIIVHEQENFFNSTDEWGNSELVMAATVTAFDGSSVDITDPTIGEIKFYSKVWNNS